MPDVFTTAWLVLEPRQESAGRAKAATVTLTRRRLVRHARVEAQLGESGWVCLKPGIWIQGFGPSENARPFGFKPLKPSKTGTLHKRTH